RRLLTAAPTTPMWAIRDPSVVSVSPETDQEEVARLVAKYDLVSVPVTDRERRLLGTISVEDVIDVLGEEASEDIFRLAGSDASELERRSPRQIETTSIIGAVCGVVVGVLGAVWHGTLSFGLVVAVSMFISVNLSGAAGTAIPMVSKSLGFDPALTAGPFETALQDVLGVTIFLGLATALLRFLA